MSKAEKTREFIIEKVAPIFNKKGYAGTSLSDITEATGLTKGSIYGNFENKDEVVLAVYEHNISLLSAKLDAALADKQTASDKLEALLGFYRSNWKATFERGGCPILNSAIEADDNLPILKGNVQNSIKAWVKRISNVIESGKESGEFRKDISPDNYAYMMLTIIEGGIMLAKITNNQNLLFSALDRVSRIVEEEIKE